VALIEMLEKQKEQDFCVGAIESVSSLFFKPVNLLDQNKHGKGNNEKADYIINKNSLIKRCDPAALATASVSKVPSPLSTKK